MATGVAWRSANPSQLFTLSFTLLWVGAFVVGANARLLGFRLPLLPTVAFLLYALTPLAVTSLVLVTLPQIWIVKVISVLIASIWSVMAGGQLLEGDPALENRKPLAWFPIFMFIFLQGWLLIII